MYYQDAYNNSFTFKTYRFSTGNIQTFLGPPGTRKHTGIGTVLLRKGIVYNTVTGGIVLAMGSTSKLWLGVSVLIFIILYFAVNYWEIGKIDNGELVHGPEVRYLDSDKQMVRLWFMALDCRISNVKYYAKMAVLSAQHFTNLVPVLMLHCPDPELENWMQKHDVIIADPKNSMLVQYLDQHKDKLTNLGASTWYRIAIPVVIDDLLKANNSRIITLRNENPKYMEYVLYTDADIVFVNNLTITTKLLPRYFSLPIQGDHLYSNNNPFSKQIHTNAGVILMNVTAFRSIETEFITYILKHIMHNNEGSIVFNDQTAFHSFFPIHFKSLSIYQLIILRIWYTSYYNTLFAKYYSDVLLKIYEWEPYLGINKDAVILHWHGPKVSINSCMQLSIQGLHNYVHINSSGSDNTGTIAKSLFIEEQGVLKQLLKYNRTSSHIKQQPLLLPQEEDQHQQQDEQPLLPQQEEEDQWDIDYPPPYDWYNHARLSPEDITEVLHSADQYIHPLQYHTSHSLDGYEYATNLYFSYLNLICQEEAVGKMKV